MSEQLVREIQDVRFTPTRGREGYDMGQVDYFLDQLCAALAAGQPVDGMLDGARFTPVRLREGYDMGEVDGLLQRVRTAASAPAPPETPAAAPEAGRPTGAAEPAEPGEPGGVGGFLRRLFRARQS